ncbi:DUF2164 domain-containing protein [Lachnoclostridium phytofermentans]|uniref:DUF2164 domain-containing protein n=1 Tax=Lachnoclostridium phytofermentans (strain ATCC 700394 / DSM 18823 / ISDg) TaxID=357809 RepID=A9KN69_LACP7|nr:DUF2164 domain-containing protein [Lachnoclostridium phytofermentans]ABX41568.1 conserved hypothetical protein [Lachnoclostridium phytofermentans ISDg]
MEKTYSKFRFSQEEKSMMQDAIIQYFEEERDEKLGIIGSENLLDFVLELIGDKIYNTALDDAKKFYKRSLEDLESDYYGLYKD